MDEVQWWDKKQARFLKVSHPEVVRLYNEAMGGVDLLDQLGLYRTEIWSSLRMIMHAFDLAVVKIWSEYRLDAEKAKMPPKRHCGFPPFQTEGVPMSGESTEDSGSKTLKIQQVS